MKSRKDLEREIIVKRRLGWSLRKIGDKVGLSAQQVNKIIAKREARDKLAKELPLNLPKDEESFRIIQRIINACEGKRWDEIEAMSDYELSQIPNLGKKCIKFIRSYQPDYIPNKKELALDLLQSVRGQYILGQALYVAIKSLKRVKKPKREESNILDMQLLLDEVFPLGHLQEEMENEQRTT